MLPPQALESMEEAEISQKGVCLLQEALGPGGVVQAFEARCPGVSGIKPSKLVLYPPRLQRAPLSVQAAGREQGQTVSQLLAGRPTP